MKSLFFFFTDRQRRTLWLALLWTALILFACFIPGEDVPQVDLPLIDKWVHFILFGVCSFLWACTFRQWSVRYAAVVFVCCAALGCLVELVQGSGWVRGRSCEFKDILADVIGAFLGLLLFGFFRRRWPAEGRS